MKLDVERRTLRFSRPLRTSYGELVERELLAVALTGDDGVTGYGEAAPLESYDGVSLQRTEAALERYASVLAAAAGLGGAQLVEACRRADELPVALAAIDLALWDRGGRISGRPIAALLTDTPAATVPVNATIGATDRAGACGVQSRSDGVCEWVHRPGAEASVVAPLQDLVDRRGRGVDDFCGDGGGEGLAQFGRLLAQRCIAQRCL